MSAVDPIPVEAPPASLLTVSREIPGGFEAWRDGVTWQALSCNRIHGWGPCTLETRAEEKCEPIDAVIPAFVPWTIYTSDGCDAGTPSRGLDFDARTRAVLDAYSAGEVSFELATGENSGNASLESTAALVGGIEAAMPIVDAVQLLIQARVTAGYYGRHVLHVPLWLIPGMEANYLIGPDGRSTMGLVSVSPGPGYPGRSPAATVGPPAGVSDPATGEGWIYVSGPVEYGLGEPFVRNLEGSSMLLDKEESYAERMAIVRFDTCGVFAVPALVGE